MKLALHEPSPLPLSRKRERGACLSHSCLSHSCLSHSYLSHSCLSHARLSHARLSHACLNKNDMHRINSPLARLREKEGKTQLTALLRSNRKRFRLHPRAAATKDIAYPSQHMPAAKAAPP